MTSREVLELFYPAHAMHSVANVMTTSKQVVLNCSCGTANLIVSENVAKRHKTSIANLTHALRNAPRYPENKA